MATLDNLSADQRAIIELVLRQEQTYEDLSKVLGTPTSRVRELARDALKQLAPVSAERVDPDWRGQVADYLLNQQSGPEVTATRGHLKRSEPARVWAVSIVDSLDNLYANGTQPKIPEADPGAAAKPKREPRRRERAAGPLSPEAHAVVVRRRVIGGLLALAAIAAFLLFIEPGWVTDSGGGSKNSASATPTASKAQSSQPVPVGQVNLKPVGGGSAKGVALLVDRGGELRLIIQATGLKPTPAGTTQNPGKAYETWLYNSCSDAKSLGAGKTDQNGTYQGESASPVTAKQLAKFKFIDISLENIDRNPRHSCNSVLRGRIDQIQRTGGAGAQQGGTGGVAPQGGGTGGTGVAPQGGGTGGVAPQGGGAGGTGTP